MKDGDLPEEPECREVIVFIVANRETMHRVLSDVRPGIFDANKENPLEPYASALHTQLSGYSECIDADDGEGDRLEAEIEAARGKILAIFAAAANMPTENSPVKQALQKPSLPPSLKSHGKKRPK